MPELLSSPTLWLILKSWPLFLLTALIGWWLRSLMSGSKKGSGTKSVDNSQWKERFETASREREDLRQKFEKLSADHEKCGVIRADYEKLQSSAIDRGDYQKVEAELETAKAALDEKDGRVVDLITARDQARNDLQQLKSSGIDPDEVKRLKKRVEERDGQLDKLRYDLKNVGADDVVKKDAQIEKLKDELMEAKAAAPSEGSGALGLAAGAVAGVAAGSALGGDSNDGEDLGQLKARLEALEVQRDNLKAERDEARHAASSAPDTGEIDALQKVADDKQWRIGELEAELEKAKGEANAAPDTSEVDSLKGQLGEKDSTIADLEAKLAAQSAAPAETPAAEEPAVEEEPEPDRPADVSGYTSYLSQYEGESVEAQVQPGVIFTSAPSCADDLKEISGVGPKLEETLNENGVYRFQQVSDWNEYNIWYFNKIMAFPGRIQRDEWIKQAGELAKTSKCTGGGSETEAPAPSESGHYSHTTTKGSKMYLYSREQELKNSDQTTVMYYFSKDPDHPKGTKISEVPADREVSETATGMLVLKKKD